MSFTVGKPGNPFMTRPGDNVQAIDADSRLRMVKTFNGDQLRAALDVPGLQMTVKAAIDRRLKKIKTIVYPWGESEPIMDALVKRNYSFKLDGAGLTVEWEDPAIKESDLRALIAGWVAQDRVAARTTQKRDAGSARLKRRCAK